MNRRKRRTTNKKASIENKKIIRCKHKMIPVFESDICKDFIKRENTEGYEICKNCKNSF